MRVSRKKKGCIPEFGEVDDKIASWTVHGPIPGGVAWQHEEDRNRTVNDYHRVPAATCWLMYILIPVRVSPESKLKTNMTFNDFPPISLALAGRRFGDRSEPLQAWTQP